MKSVLFVLGLIAVFATMQPACAQSEAARSPDARRRGLVEIGRALFSDRRLSADGSTSCADCHLPDKAFADPRPVSLGIASRPGQRNAPSLLDVGDRRLLFWDGRAQSLSAQALQPLMNAREQGFHDPAAIERRLGGMEGEAKALRVIAGSTRTLLPTALDALAAFERTLRSAALPIDRLVRDSSTSDVPLAVQRGWEVFRGPAHCIECHRVDAGRPQFTDDQFHAAARGVEGALLARLPKILMQIERAAAAGGEAAVGQLIAEDHDVAALGRFVVTRDPKDVGAFRTPGLRSVALTAPYMHDGSVATLEEAVDFELYRTGDGIRRPVPIGADERSDLLAFMKSLASTRQ